MMEFSGCSLLYVDPVDSENKEEYLEAVWIIGETGESPVRISSISQKLKITPPSAVQMLKKLEKEGCINYKNREGVTLTRKGSSNTDDELVLQHSDKDGSQPVGDGQVIHILIVGSDVDSKI